MCGGNVVDLLKVRDGSGDFKNPIVGTSRKAQLIYGRFKQSVRRNIDTAMDFDLAAGHLSVTENL